MTADCNVASYEPRVPDVSDDTNDVVHICIIAYDVSLNVRRYHGWYRRRCRYSFEQRSITTEERRHDVTECINLSADRYVATYEPGVPDVSCNDVGIVADDVASDVTDDISSDVTDEERCYDVAECVNLPADRDIASYEPDISDVSDDTYDVVHVCVIADDVAIDVTITIGW